MKSRSAYIRIAERALGKPLPQGAEVHHVDGDPTNNRPQNLVICENKAYHQLLHKRARARGWVPALSSTPYLLRDIDPALWRLVKSKAALEGETVKAVIERLLRQYVRGNPSAGVESPDMKALMLAFVVAVLLLAAPVAAQTAGQTFVMLDGISVDLDVPTTVHVDGWALKCQGTILGVHAYARAVGFRTWQGWGRDFATFHPRPDVAYSAMSDDAGVHRCAHPTEYAGFRVAIDTSRPDLLSHTAWRPGAYDVIVCVEDSAGGRGWLTTCTGLLRFVQP